MVDAFVAIIAERNGRTLESTIRARNYMVQMNSTTGTTADATGLIGQSTG